MTPISTEQKVSVEIKKQERGKKDEK